MRAKSLLKTAGLVALMGLTPVSLLRAQTISGTSLTTPRGITCWATAVRRGTAAAPDGLSWASGARAGR